MFADQYDEHTNMDRTHVLVGLFPESRIFGELIGFLSVLFKISFECAHREAVISTGSFRAI